MTSVARPSVAAETSSVGGSVDTLHNDVQVKPVGLPSTSVLVTTATPLGK
jgi:hypothetical protein